MGQIFAQFFSALFKQSKERYKERVCGGELTLISEAQWQKMWAPG